MIEALLIIILFRGTVEDIEVVPMSTLAVCERMASQMLPYFIGRPARVFCIGDPLPEPPKQE